MSLRRFGLVGAIVAAVAAVQQRPSTPTPPLRAAPVLDTALPAALLQASVVFRGTVLGPDSVGASGGRPIAALVHVDSVWRSAGLIGDFKNSVVRLILPPGVTETPRVNAVFLAHGLTAGATLTLRELRRITFATLGERIAIESMLEVAQGTNETNALVERQRQSDAVVIATVESTAVIPVPDSVRRVRVEHSPDWNRALVRITKAFGPNASSLIGTRVWVLYVSDADEDINQADAPDLEIGMRSLLLLRWAHRLDPLARNGVNVTGKYFVFDPGDVLRPSDSLRLAPFVMRTPR